MFEIRHLFYKVFGIIKFYHFYVHWYFYSAYLDTFIAFITPNRQVAYMCVRVAHISIIYTSFTTFRANIILC